MLEISTHDDVARIANQVCAAIRWQCGSIDEAVVLKEGVGGRRKLFLFALLVSESVSIGYREENMGQPRAASAMMTTKHEKSSYALVIKRRSVLGWRPGSFF